MLGFCMPRGYDVEKVHNANFVRPVEGCVQAPKEILKQCNV